MGMRLLGKSDVAKAKSIERQREVDEGVKLAKRVDSLRELAADEEANFEKFRSETVSNINEQITKKAEERDALDRELLEKREERERLTQPLDAAWIEVSDIKAGLDRREVGLAAREDYVRGQEHKATRTIKEAESALRRAEGMQDSAAKAYQRAEELQTEARKTLQEAQTTRQLAIEAIEKESEALTHRENMVIQQEKGATIREATILEREKENRIEKARLADERKTLERAFSRLNNNHGKRI